MQQNYNLYSTNLKLAASLNIIPEKYKKEIPRSNLYRWKHTDFTKYMGLNQDDKLKKEAGLIKSFAQDKSAQKLYRTIIRIKNTIITVLTMFKTGADLFDIKQKVVSAIKQVLPVIGLKKALKFFKMKTGKYYAWLKEVKNKCLTSPVAKCLRSFPNQLTKQEVAKIKEMLTGQQFEGWPIHSICSHAIRKGILYANVSTWYKYNKILGIKRSKPKSRRKKNAVGIRADSLHKIWHADVTIYKFPNNIKAYIYLLIENISRAILSFRVSPVLSGSIRMETIKESYDKYIRNKIENPEIDLIVDGGAENNNLIVENFLSKPDVYIQKVLALSENFPYSNSMIEAANKYLKYRYLYLHDIPDIENLKKHMEKFVPVYNTIRPHIAHKYLTPQEVLDDCRLDYTEIEKKFKEAGRFRVEFNKKNLCGVCT